MNSKKSKKKWRQANAERLSISETISQHIEKRVGSICSIVQGTKGMIVGKKGIIQQAMEVSHDF